jgi:hypothetical protein
LPKATQRVHESIAHFDFNVLLHPRSRNKILRIRHVAGGRRSRFGTSRAPIGYRVGRGGVSDIGRRLGTASSAPLKNRIGVVPLPRGTRRSCRHCHEAFSLTQPVAVPPHPSRYVWRRRRASCGIRTHDRLLLSGRRHAKVPLPWRADFSCAPASAPARADKAARHLYVGLFSRNRTQYLSDREIQPSKEEAGDCSHPQKPNFGDLM